MCVELTEFVGQSLELAQVREALSGNKLAAYGGAPCPIRKLQLNTSKKPGDDGGIGLAEAIAVLRDELLKARAAGADSDIQLPVESMTVELRVAATRSKDGRTGFKVPVLEVELGGGMAAGSETGQTVTVVFGAPVDRTGAVVKVAEATDELKG